MLFVRASIARWFRAGTRTSGAIVNLAMSSFVSAWATNRCELRIDVGTHPTQSIDTELEALYDRLNDPRSRLYGLPDLPLGKTGLRMRYREADGEYYVYVEDPQHRRLVGFTVFNRLIEVNRRVDRVVRAPHSKYHVDYQRRGLATAVYRWALDAGVCLMTGARQSPAANALWHALAKQYERGYVALRNKNLCYLGTDIAPSVLDDLSTRMILLRPDWVMTDFVAATGSAREPLLR